jgi:hypothetical protein
MDESTGILELPGQAKINKMDNIRVQGTRWDKNVFGFDIAMNNVSGMNEFQMRKLMFVP